MKKLVAYGKDIQPLLEGVPPWRVDPAIEDLFQRQEWELLSVLMLSAVDATTRKVVPRLLDLKIYEPLVLAACMRRHIRSQPQIVGGNSGIASRVFRDIEAEGEGTSGVPDQILEDIRDMAESAARTRESQTLRSEGIDRGPMREYIINRLTERLLTDDGALEALLTIVLAAGWEETRRTAAMKIANSEPAMKRLAGQKRTGDMIQIAETARLGAVAQRVAELLAEHLDDLKAAGDSAAVEFIEKHHPDSSASEPAGGTPTG